MFDIRLEGKAPIYEQLYSGISRLISSGQMKPDERLPAVREVAKQMGINPNTVQKTYALLEQNGLIYSIPAKGSYVSADPRAVSALHDNALEKLRRSMTEAKTCGVTSAEMLQAAKEIWSDDRNEGDQ